VAVVLANLTRQNVDSRLRTRCSATHDDHLLLVFIVELNLVGISAVTLVVSLFYHRLGINMTRHRAIVWKHDAIHKTGST